MTRAENLRKYQSKYIRTEKGRKARAAWYATPRGKFNHQRSQAGIRGVSFELTFEQWWELWEPHWEKRGKCSECMVMARHGDKGPYAVGNVTIKTSYENAMESNEA